MPLTEQELKIQREAAACRKACKDSKVGDLMQHIHHERWLEKLTEPIENRITFILTRKATSEQPERLRRLRPFDWNKADADWNKAYANREKADAAWEKADADWEKAYANWKKADAAWKKAYANWEKADASPAMLTFHTEMCGCPWDATHNIFGGVR